eukprot:GILJ01006126.1.p1 GENE.GILJ01006126.1~~GILJ01006126.1.p1  ORF type:complete len:505 (-),score=77.93 GILJ01006126.1:101-1615(-)
MPVGPQDVISALTEVFHRFDLNDDGILDSAEFAIFDKLLSGDSFPSNDSLRVEDWLDFYRQTFAFGEIGLEVLSDLGKLGYDENLKLSNRVARLINGNTLNSLFMAALHEIFSRFDRDTDGVLNAVELKTLDPESFEFDILEYTTQPDMCSFGNFVRAFRVLAAKDLDAAWKVLKKMGYNHNLELDSRLKRLIAAGAPTPEFVNAIRDIFERFDFDQNGLLKKSELDLFQIACDGEALDDELFQAVTNGKDGLDLETFIDNFYKQTALDCEETFDELKFLGYDDDLVLDEIAGKLLAGSRLTPTFQDVLNEIFTRFDADHDGELNADELTAWNLAATAATMEAEQLQTLLEEFETGPHGGLTKKGFLDAQHRRTVCDFFDIWDEIQSLGYDDELHLDSNITKLISNGELTAGFRSMLEDLFSQFDEDKDGCLSRDELNRLAKFGSDNDHDLDDLTFESIGRHCEVDSRGYLTKTGFMQSYYRQAAAYPQDVMNEIMNWGWSHKL